MEKPIKRRRKPRNEALVHGHLERVSRRLLEDHYDVVRRFVSRGVGIYALYRKDRLYYVGLAGALSGRLKAHLRDHHKSSWDRFSIYLTVRDQHVKEIESLLLRIARPRGNRVSGRTTSSKDLRGLLQRAVKQRYQQDVNSLFARSSRAESLQIRKAASTEGQKLIRLFPEGARIRGTNKGAIIRATVRRDGRVGYAGTIYKSLSAAAKVAVKHSINGWWFWHVERGKGNWVRLTGDFDHIIACRAGYGLEIADPAAFLLSRMTAAFDSVFARSQNFATTRLFELKAAGRIRNVLLPYLGQDDSRLASPSPELVPRDSVAGYPTNFSAMPVEWIDRLSRRGEQLVYALLREHWPELRPVGERA